MTEPGTYRTVTADMFAVHQAISGALGEAPGLVGTAGTDAVRAETVGSFYENVLEFLRVHHSGEDELVYPVLEERCVAERAMLARVEAQHTELDGPMGAAVRRHRLLAGRTVDGRRGGLVPWPRLTPSAGRCVPTSRTRSTWCCRSPACGCPRRSGPNSRATACGRSGATSRGSRSVSSATS